MKNVTPSMEASESTGDSNNNNTLPSSFLSNLPPLLQPLYQAHLQRLEANPELQQAFAYFVPPDATLSRGSEARKPLSEEIQHFLMQQQTPLLITARGFRQW